MIMFFGKSHIIGFITATMTCFTILGCAQFKNLLFFKERLPYGHLSVLNIENETQVKIVENFNNVHFVNQLKGKNSILPADDALKINTLYLKADAIREQGKSLAIIYAINPEEEVSWATDANHLDVSQAKAISFWINMVDNDIAEYASIDIEDSDGRRATFSLAMYLARERRKNSWREIIIPREDFPEINWNSIKHITITLRAIEEPLRGTMLIDNIVFVGDRRLYFFSLQDNLFGFPTTLINNARKETLLNSSDRELLLAVAQDTWRFFENTTDKNSFLPLDTLKVDQRQWIGDYVSITDVGLYLICCVGAVELGLISQSEAEMRIIRCLETLKKLPRWKGFHYNYYNTTTLQPTSAFVSTVDCGWLAAGLMVARQSFKGVVEQHATAILEAMDFALLYDTEVGQLRLGYDATKGELAKYHYGLLATEARVASLIAIGKGDVEKQHWFRIYRALPPEWDWQSQIPQGTTRTYLGQTVFQGCYQYKDKKIVPSWGGSLFEFLMPTLVVDEKRLAPAGLGANNRIATEIHIDYALNEKNYGVWGLSPCSIAGRVYGGYSEFGVPEIGAKGYSGRDIVTPHVSFLALDVMPTQALANIREMLKRFDIYGEYGVYDSVIVTANQVSYKYLALDQAMIFISTVNYLKEDIIKKRYHSDPIMKASEDLLGMESFFE